MYCLEFIKFGDSNTSYYVEVENGRLLCDVARSRKMIIGGHGNSWKKLCKFFLGKSVGTLPATHPTFLLKC